MNETKMNKTIQEWIGGDMNTKIFIEPYQDGYNQALKDLKERIPELVEKIDNIRQTDREKVVENITQGLTTMKIGGQEGYIPNDIAKRLKNK